MKTLQGYEREELTERVLWSTSVCFLDIYQHAPQEFKDRVDKMSNDELEQFIEENKHSWQKGLDGGLLTASDVVYRTLAQNTELPTKDEPDEEYYEKSWMEHSGMKLNRKERNK